MDNSKNKVFNVYEKNRADNQQGSSDTTGVEKSSDRHEESVDSNVEIQNVEDIKFDAGNNIEFILPDNILPRDRLIYSRPWDADASCSFMKNNLSTDQKLQTDLYQIEIKSPTANNITFFNFPATEPSEITIKVNIKSLGDVSKRALRFKAYIKKENENWEMKPAKYIDRAVIFHANQIESFCIISFPREEESILNPNQSEELAFEVDDRMKILIEEGSVRKQEKIKCKIIPIDRVLLGARLNRNPNTFPILATSECLSVNVSVSSFLKPVEVHLPIDDLPGVDSAHWDHKIIALKKKGDGPFLVDESVKVEEENKMAKFRVKSFSQYIIMKVDRKVYEQLKPNLGEITDDALGNNCFCKILYFTGDMKQNAVNVILECVIKEEVDAVCKRRNDMGYSLVKSMISSDLRFPIGHRIRIDVGGIFSLPKHIRKDYYFINFFPLKEDNFVTFLFEKNVQIHRQSYGIIYFKDDKGMKHDLHIVHHDPWYKKSQNTLQQSREGSRLNLHQLTSLPEKPFEEGFFRDSGILAIVQRLGPDSLYSVLINMEIQQAEYEQIMADTSKNSTEKKVILLHKALLIPGKVSKIHRLTTALSLADENVLAGKIKYLYDNKLRLGKDTLHCQQTKL